MAVTVPTSKPKTVFYKMVTVPKVKVTAQNAATVSSYKAFTTGMNRLGATLNSMVVVNKQFYDSMLSGLKLKVAEQDEQRKRFDNEKQDNKKGSGLEKLASNFVKASILGMGDALKGIMMLFDSVLKLVISQALLRWIANPANTKKLTVLWNAITGFFKFLWDFVSTNIGKTLSGLADMLDSNKNFWERLQGFGTFIVGFGSLLIGFAFLRKPKLLISGVKFVLKTIWDSVSGLVKVLSGRKTSKFTSGAAAAAGSVGKGGGRGSLLKGLAAGTAVFAPLVIGGMMGGGDSEFMKSAGAPAGGSPTPPPDNIPHAAEGGIFTRPTRALIGERGPEARIPLTTPADNKQRMSRSGVKPLSSIKGDSKQAQKLSDLFMAPFRGIGAGILANVSQVVSGMGTSGQALTPILGNIITPIANSFGVPPSLVKTLTAKTQVSGKSQEQIQGGKTKSDTSKLFGKGRLVSEDSKKFKKVGDTSVLGLLSNMVAAVQVIGNKAGKGSNNIPPPPATPQSSIDQSSKSAKAAGESGAGSTDQTRKGATSAMSAGQSSQAGSSFSSKSKDRKGGQVPFQVKGKKYKVVINATNGDYEVWEDAVFGKQIDIKNGKNEWLKQKAFNQVRAYYVNNAPQKGKELHYLTEEDLKNRDKVLETAKKEQGAAAGGWISGPMSGYPVSLDGGGSTSFIGHGTEWVGFKRAAGGSAFVVPFDTPATRNNPGLTDSRMRQAKQGGYALPYAKGGTISTDPRWKGDTGPGSRWDFVSNQKSKENWRRRNKNKFADGGKIAEAAKSMVGQYFGPNGCAKSTRAMLAKAGVAPSPLVTSKVLDKGTPGAEPTGSLKANSFGPDQGAVIKSSGAVKEGDIVMWDTGGGVIGHVGVAIGNGQVVHNSSSAGHKLARMGVTGMKFHSAIRLGQTGTITASGDQSSTDTTTEGGSNRLLDMDPLDAMRRAFDAFAGGPQAVQAAGNELGTKAFAPASQGGANIGTATTAVAFQKDLLKQNTLNTAAASVAGAKAATAQQKGQVPPAPPAAKPIILPGPSRSLDIAHLNPRTSITAYSIGGIL